MRSLQAASAQNPDDYARRLQLSKQSNIPAAWIPEFKDEAAHRAIAADPLVQNLHETHPATAEYFSRKDNAAVSQDDMKAMARMEKLAKEGFGKQEPISTLTSGNFFSQETRDEAHKAVSGFIPRLAQKWGGLQLYAGEMLQKEYPFVYGANGYGADLAERGRALLVGSHDDLAATHSENEAVKLIQGIVDMAPAMALAPFTGGLSVIADAGLGSMGGKYAANRMAGKDTDDSQASAVASGALNAAAMLIPMKHLLKPGYSLFKRTMITTLATTLGMDVAEVGTLITDKASVNPEMTLLEAASDLLETTGMGLAQGFAMAPISHPMEKLHERVTGIKRGPNAVDPVAKAERHAATLEQMGATVQESKTNGRAPDKVAEHIAAIKKAHGGQVDNAYVPVEAWNTLFQNAGMDPAQVAESVLSDPRRYSEALHTGSDIAIPLEEFVTGLSGMEQYKDLVQNTRMGQGDLTPVEAKEFKATERERFTAALNEVDSAHQAGAPARKVYADVKRQLVEAEGDPQNAHQEAAIVMASFRALEKIHPTMDAWELYQQHGLGIKQELPDILTKRGTVNPYTDSMLEELRAGKTLSDREVNGPSLMDFLKGKGGLKDHGGELKAMDVKSRKKGLPLDRARELAVEAGYLPEGADINALLEAVRAETAGEGVYAAANLNAKNQERREQQNDMTRVLDMLGLDIHTATNEEIRQAINSSQELYQRDIEQGKTPQETQAGQLRPAVVIDGKTIVGEVGTDHKATREAHGHEDGEGDAGFVAADGKFMTREEAKAWVEQNQPEAFKHLPKGEMHSQPYAEAVAKAGEKQTLYQKDIPQDVIRQVAGTEPSEVRSVNETVDTSDWRKQRTKDVWENDFKPTTTEPLRNMVIRPDFNIVVTNSGLKHNRTFSGDIRKMLVFDNLRDILTRATYAFTELPDPRKAGKKNIEAYHKLLMPVMFGDELAIVKITLQQDNMGKVFYDSRVQDVEIEKPADGNSGLSTGLSPESQHTDIQQAFTNSIVKLFNSKRKTLYQSAPTPGDARGKITFGPNGVDITLLAKADRTTLEEREERGREGRP